MKYFFVFLAFTLLLVPNVGFAITCPTTVTLPPQSLTQIVCLSFEYIEPLTVLLIGASLLVFVWGVAKFIWASGDEKKIQDGKTLMFWGIVALFVMVSVWGILRLFYSDIFGNFGFGVPQLEEND